MPCRHCRIQVMTSRKYAILGCPSRIATSVCCGIVLCTWQMRLTKPNVVFFFVMDDTVVDLESHQNYTFKSYFILV